MEVREYCKTNLHTHSTYCDGKSTLREMAESAVQKGFQILGFSSHSMYPFSSDWHMEANSHRAYVDEVRSLQKEFAGRLEIMLGFESDYLPGICLPAFDLYREFSPDFLIGSVHFIYSDKGTFAVDGSPDELMKGIKRVFKGSVEKAVGAYFSAQREMLASGDFTIIGHPDLIRKFDSRVSFLDTNASWYRRELKDMARAIAKSGVIAEINTGAISRGYQTSPYPSDEFLSLLHEKNVPVTINSDAHAADQLDCSFDLARQCAKKAGYREFCVPRAGSLEFFKL